jgi:hypothetical protein
MYANQFYTKIFLDRNKSKKCVCTLASIFGSSKKPSGNTSAMLAGLTFTVSAFSPSGFTPASKKSEANRYKTIIKLKKNQRKTNKQINNKTQQV